MFQKFVQPTIWKIKSNSVSIPVSCSKIGSRVGCEWNPYSLAAGKLPFPSGSSVQGLLFWGGPWLAVQMKMAELAGVSGRRSSLTGARSVEMNSLYLCCWGPSLRSLPFWTSCKQKLTQTQLMENVRENVSGQLSEMSVVHGLVVQDKLLFWQHLPLNNFYICSGQQDHYFLGEPYSLTQRLPTSLQLFSSSLLSFSLHFKSSFSGNWNLRGFLECLCEEVGGMKWQFIRGNGTGRAPSVGGRLIGYRYESAWSSRQ